jgi:hypothetical protein
MLYNMHFYPTIGYAPSPARPTFCELTKKPAFRCEMGLFVAPN